MLRAVALSGSAASYDYANLGRAFRNLEMLVVESYFTATAVESSSDGERDDLLEERIITAANCGLWEEAAALLDQRRKKAPSKWLDCVEAHMTLRQDRRKRRSRRWKAAWASFLRFYGVVKSRRKAFASWETFRKCLHAYQAIAALADPDDINSATAAADALYWIGVVEGDVAKAEVIYRKYQETNALPTEAHSPSGRSCAWYWPSGWKRFVAIWACPVPFHSPSLLCRIIVNRMAALYA